jgi:hypothetical protein
VPFFLKSVLGARSAAYENVSRNNLKQIELALLTYAEANKRFPSAVMLGPDGKTTYSWRVAILPYIEEAALYKMYKFDEPWDSENNKKVLQTKVKVFQHPNQNPSSNHSNYFVLTGEGGMFNSTPSKGGTKISQVTDGLSKTLLVVEAERDIPWTKPDDIPVEKGKVPPLGFGKSDKFIAGTADGAVMTFSTGIDPEVFWKFFTRAGGEPVTNEDLETKDRPAAAK